MNKRFSIASILLMTLCFTCHGWPVQTNSFDVNVNQQVERSLRIPQGEARVFDARFIDSSGSLNLTNMTAEYLYMRQMGTNWWTIPATIQSNSVLIAWDHTRDVGASRYYGWIRVGTTSSPIYRVQLDLAMIDTPGFTPNASALVIAPIDFAELSWTNAPWDAETNTVYGRQGSEWVEIGGGGTGDVISVFGRAGIVIADESDYAQFYAPSSRVAAIELWPTGNWSTAYGWGNHALGGYATGTPLYVESDPAWHSGTGAIWTAIGNAEPANYAAVSNAAITAHGWGDHAAEGYATGTPLYVETYLGTITGATITGGTVTTNEGILAFAVESTDTGWTNLAFSGTGNAITGATAAGTTLTLERGNIEGGGGGGTSTNEVRAIRDEAFRPYTTLGLSGGTALVTRASGQWVMIEADDGEVTLDVDVAAYTNSLEAIRHQICWVRGTNETYTVITNNIDNTTYVDCPASTTNHLFLERRPGWPRFQIWQDFR